MTILLIAANTHYRELCFVHITCQRFITTLSVNHSTATNETFMCLFIYHGDFILNQKTNTVRGLRMKIFDLPKENSSLGISKPFSNTSTPTL